MSGVGITYLWASKEFPPFVRLEGKRGDYEVYVPERTCENIDEASNCGYFKCSECNTECSVEWCYSGYSTPNYCPNCGRKVKR